MYFNKKYGRKKKENEIFSVEILFVFNQVLVKFENKVCLRIHTYSE